MKCPICDVTLLISDKQGVEVDYCPQCRGVWLDRGELDKILGHQPDHDYPDNYNRRKKKNKFEMLTDIFDF